LDYLKGHLDFAGEYHGVDLSANMVAVARRKHPEAFVEQRDILAEGLCADFDVAFVAGVFNNLMADNDRFMKDTLRTIFPRVRKALAFNLISNYVDYRDEGLYYADPEEMFRFCKEELSPCVTLRHDYLIRPGSPPFEFTLYVYRTPHENRRKNFPNQ
jgi:hypothetical protein